MNEEQYEKFKAERDTERFGDNSVYGGMNFCVRDERSRVRKMMALSTLGGVFLAAALIACGFLIARGFVDFDMVANGSSLNITVTPKGQDRIESVDPAEGPDGEAGAADAQKGGAPALTVAAGELKPTGQGDASVVIADPSDGTGLRELSNPEIAARVRPSVVGIQSESLRYARSSTGSGIIMSADGYIITNHHVVENVDKITVVLDDGGKYNATIVGLDQKSDLAVIKIEAEGLNAVEFGDSDQVVVGDPAMAIGNPYGLELQGTVTVGVISAINRDIAVSEERVMTLIQTDASINPGNSGGPLVNKYGRVIGINTIKLGVSYYEGLGFAIPINTAKPILEDLIKYGSVQDRPAIGITGWVVTPSYSRTSNLPIGVYVETVDERGGAYAAGLRSGDVITKANGKEITAMAELNKEKETMRVGDKIVLMVERGGTSLELAVELVDEAVVS